MGVTITINLSSGKEIQLTYAEYIELQSNLVLSCGVSERGVIPPNIAPFVMPFVGPFPVYGPCTTKVSDTGTMDL